MLRRVAARIDRVWFYSPGTAWRPRRFEWFFTRTRKGRRIRTEERAAVTAALEPCWSSDGHVLEIGSGTGLYTAMLAETFGEVVAVDCSAAMRRYLQRRLWRSRIENVRVCEGCLPDGIDLPRGFDGVVSVGVLNYVADLEASLRTFARLAKPGAWFVFTVPADTPEGRRYRREELVTRRRIFLRSDPEIVAAASGAGMRIETTETAARITRVVRTVTT